LSYLGPINAFNPSFCLKSNRWFEQYEFLQSPNSITKKVWIDDKHPRFSFFMLIQDIGVVALVWELWFLKQSWNYQSFKKLQISSIPVLLLLMTLSAIMLSSHLSHWNYLDIYR